jgi:hypothetical protein
MDLGLSSSKACNDNLFAFKGVSQSETNYVNHALEQVKLTFVLLPESNPCQCSKILPSPPNPTSRFQESYLRRLDPFGRHTLTLHPKLTKPPSKFVFISSFLLVTSLSVLATLYSNATPE